MSDTVFFSRRRLQLDTKFLGDTVTCADGVKPSLFTVLFYCYSTLGQSQPESGRERWFRRLNS